MYVFFRNYRQCINFIFHSKQIYNTYILHIWQIYRSKVVSPVSMRKFNVFGGFQNITYERYVVKNEVFLMFRYTADGANKLYRGIRYISFFKNSFIVLKWSRHKNIFFRMMRRFLALVSQNLKKVRIQQGWKLLVTTFELQPLGLEDLVRFFSRK